MRRLSAATLSFLFAASTLLCSSADALVIDEFDNDSPEVVSTGPEAMNTIASASAIGGARTLVAKRTSGSYGVRIRTSLGQLAHSQDSEVAGYSRVIWNGGKGTNNFTGLGSIDLTQDGATAVILKGISFDFAGLKPISLTFTFYDASDATGSKSSSYYLNLTKPYESQDVTVPFTSFDQVGLGGPAAFTNIGSIMLTVNGVYPNVDLALASVETNGKCDLIPDSSGRVIDDCGECGSTNRLKDDCGVCDGKNAAKDKCGVCFGDNSSCKDCSGIPNGSSKLDVCGVCEGNGTSCLDCAGVPNGKSVKDVCGVCDGDGTSCLDCQGKPFGVSTTDRCGICGGDGQSCIKCTEKDLTDLLNSMAEKSKDQKGNALFFVLRVISSARSFAKLSKVQILKLYAELIAELKQIPSQVKLCEETPFCTRQTEHVGVVKTYEKTALKLYRVTLKIINHKLPSTGSCRGSTGSCYKRVQDRERRVSSLRTVAYRTYRENVKLARKIPKETSVCR